MNKKLFSLALLFVGLAFIAHAQTLDLDYFLRKAEANSPLLKDYQDQIRSGSIDSMLVRASNKPRVLANGQILVPPTFHRYGYDEAITNGGNYIATVAVSQPIFNKKMLTPRYRSIELANEKLGNRKQVSVLDLRKSITTQYIAAYADYYQLLSNQEVFTLLKQEQELLKKLVINGVYSQTDYLSFMVTCQSQEIALSQLRMQYKLDLSTLNYLSGIQDTASVLLASPDLVPVINKSAFNSDFYKTYTIDSLTIINNKAAIDARYKPTVSWFANAGLQTSTLHTFYRNFGASFGLDFSLTIYDGKQRSLEYQKLKIAEDIRTKYADFFGRQYEQQRNMLLQQLEETNHLVEEIKAKSNTIQTLFETDNKLLNTGELKITDYILSVQNYLNVKNDLVQAEMNRLQIINELNYWNH